MSKIDCSITVSLTSQSLRVTADDTLLFQAPVSTAAKGPREEEGTYCTPTSNIVDSDRSGDRAPLHTIFRGRRPCGIWGGEECHDGILTRILWLHGLDPENANTYQRYLYFHGTNAEQQIGTPASQGCIRLRNRDMLQLFDLAPIGTRVHIS